MKIQPTFKGKINVTVVKDEKWSWYKYKTSAKDDAKILEVAQTMCPESYTWDRQSISEKNGQKLLKTLEDAVGEKLDIPEDSSFSVTHSQNYNFLKNKNMHSILLFCEEKFSKRGKYTGDRTAIDIFI